MEFDVASDGEVFAQSLERARRGILRGADVHTDWRQLQEKHPFFRDVVSDAERRAEVIASVLAAAEYFLQRLLSACEDGTALSVVDAKTVRQWCGSLSAFMSLYEQSPVPTRVEWASQAKGIGVQADTNGAMEVGSGENMNCNASNNNNKDNYGSEDDDDDGSFVETRLKKMLLRCVGVGRKWCHKLGGEGNKEGGEVALNIRRAVCLMDKFLAPTTLEW